MPVITEAEGIEIMAQAIAEAISGSHGGATKVATVNAVILALTSGPKTKAAILQVVEEVINDGGWIAP